MRRIWATIALTAALPLLGSSAYAAVAGTAHSSTYTAATSGDCSICHIPHAAKGNRLWPATPYTPADAGDVIGPFCYYCHNSAGGGYIAAANSNNTVFAAAGHGYGTVTNPDGNGNNSTALPYSGPSAPAGAGTIQCTTCHNPHDDTNRPFLRADIDTLCGMCHPNRGNADGAWAGYGSGNTVGAHPVGSNITGDVNTPGDTPINVAPLNLRTYGTVANYPLGAKGRNAGSSATPFATAGSLANGLVCVSCHAVHGVETADNGVNLAGTPNEDVLALTQGSVSSHANGGRGTDARNPLCEACHYTTAATANYRGVAYTGGYNVNPGGTAYTHPVDNLLSGYEMVSLFPTQWPYSTIVPGAATNGGAVCESCHMPHPAASTVAQTNDPANPTTGTPILRRAITTICDSCHTGSFNGHHPTGVAMGRYVGAGIANGKTGAQLLLCSDCHGAAGAHNWARPAGGAATDVGGFALDPAWEPSDNLRGAADIAGQFNANMSKECIDCHLRGGTALANGAPTNNSLNNNAVVATIASGTTGYQDAGDGSHWIGANGGAGQGVTYASGSVAGTAFNATSANWTGGGHSRWGSALGAVVCESCHELEPDKNIQGSSLLLGYFTDKAPNSALVPGSTGDTTVQLHGDGTAVTGNPTRGTWNATSAFCTGCHGTAPGGGTPHPMTGANITKASDSHVGPTGAARTTYTLLTNGGGYAANALSYMTQTGTNFVSLPAVDAMNCDSCHQVHDTPTTAGSWILDAQSTEVINAGFTTGGTSPTSANYQAFCLDCHVY